VSLHRGDWLRGCIGSLTASEPLGGVVARMAAAVTRDPRFPPLDLHELAGLRLEISVLSRARAMPPDRLDPARHGIVLRIGEARAVPLPQVARRHGWDRDRLLAEICSKAGVSPTAWRRADAVLRAFTVATVEGPAVDPS
jgi:AmmeMemoRadiSam system protein A